MQTNRKTNLTWKFKIKMQRRFLGIFCGFYLDAARINLPNGKKSLAISAYPSKK
jgi:hypothetical protein